MAHEADSADAYDSRDDFEAQAQDDLQRLADEVTEGITYENSGDSGEIVGVGVIALSKDEDGRVHRSSFRALDPTLTATQAIHAVRQHNVGVDTLGYEVGVRDVQTKSDVGIGTFGDFEGVMDSLRDAAMNPGE